MKQRPDPDAPDRITTEATMFDALSHRDFLRLILEAFSRQGYELEPSSAAGADGVLISKTGARIGILCKKYRGAIIGRPVLQQFQGAMDLIGCKEGYLITTTDCSPEAYEFAKGKGIDLYNRERTLGLLRTAFGDEFIRSGRMPELGPKAKTVPAAARQTISNAQYEKASVPDRKDAWEPEKPPESTAAPITGSTPGPAQASEHVKAPPAETASEELPEEVLTVENIESSGASETVSPENTATVSCAECNQRMRVPTDQGMITVTCSECGLRWLYVPEMKSDREAKTTTIMTCQTCAQQLNVPTNRGQLNVRCPKCGAKWLFTP